MSEKINIASEDVIKLKHYKDLLEKSEKEINDFLTEKYEILRDSLVNVIDEQIKLIRKYNFPFQGFHTFVIADDGTATVDKTTNFTDADKGYKLIEECEIDEEDFYKKRNVDASGLVLSFIADRTESLIKSIDETIDEEYRETMEHFIKKYDIKKNQFIRLDVKEDKLVFRILEQEDEIED